MAKRDRKCYLCGESYKYCPTCSQDNMKPAWMAEFHSENCKNIFDIATRFNLKLLTKPEAKAAMDKCDLSNKANFKSYVQRDLDNIFAEDKLIIQAEAEIKEIDVNNGEVVVDVKPVSRKAKYNHEVVNEEE